MRRPCSLLLCACALIALDGSALFGQTGKAAPRCQRVNAKVAVVKTSENCSSPIAFCSIGTISGGGVVNGRFAGTVLGLGPSAGLPDLVPNATVSFVAEHTIETPRGVLRMVGTGVFDTARGEFAEVDPITGGTGVFAEATGTLWLIGTTPDAGESFSGTVTGQVCLPR
jgi:hypothetical protein